MVKMDIYCERKFKKCSVGGYLVDVNVSYFKNGTCYGNMTQRFTIHRANQLEADAYICFKIIAQALDMQRDSYRNTEFVVHMRDVWIDGIFGKNWLVTWAARNWRNSRNIMIDGFEYWDKIFRMFSETGAKFKFVD